MGRKSVLVRGIKLKRRTCNATLKEGDVICKDGKGSYPGETGNFCKTTTSDLSSNDTVSVLDDIKSLFGLTEYGVKEAIRVGSSCPCLIEMRAFVRYGCWLVDDHGRRIGKRLGLL